MMTNYEREVQNILLNLEQVSRGQKDPKAYMLGMTLGILATLALEDNRNAKIINRSIKQNLTPPK